MSILEVHHAEIRLPRWPVGLDGCRLLHLSDLHVRTWTRTLERLRRLLFELQYDLLLVTGDFGHVPRQHATNSQHIRRLFEGVSPPGGIHGIFGNHDSPRLRPLLLDIGLRMLRNEVTTVRLNGEKFYLAGLEQIEQPAGDAFAVLAGLPPNGPTILMAHYPSTVYELRGGNVDLMLAGHTHGGQWRAPLCGCLWANDHIHPRYARGLHRINGTLLNVSAGIGTSGMFAWRINCPPEVTLLTLRSGSAPKAG